ncbi:MAG: hypothetical protein AAFV33_01420 [Chloroflexota bacterium]
MRQLFRIVSWLLWIVNTIWLLIVLLYAVSQIIFGIFGYFGNVATYWWLYDLNQSLEKYWITTAVVFLVDVVLIFLARAWVLWTGNLNKNTVNRFIGSLRAGLACFVIMPIAAFLTGMTHFMTVIEHEQTLRYNGSTYHLTFYNYDPVEGYNARYLVYHCGQFDFICREVVSVSRSYGGIAPEVTEISLVEDADSRSVALLVNGEIRPLDKEK